MMNGAQYVESLKKLKPTIFYRGKRSGRCPRS